MEVVKLPMARIFADNDFNCRGAIAPVDVWDLEKDIKQNGLMNPIIVQPYQDRYRIVAGYRRHFAASRIGMTEIDAIIRPDLSEIQARSLNLRENIIRKELNIKQEAKALRVYIAAGWKEPMIAQELQQSIGWVNIRCILLLLPEDIQNEAAAGMLTQEHIRVLHNLPSNEKRYELVRTIKEKRLKGERTRLDKGPRRLGNHAKRVRLRSEILIMIDKLSEVAGMDFHTRCMAWSAGNISTFELLRDFQKFCQEKGIDYKAPEVWEP
jgi:ParB/RepB/Spo0J family partition protein